MAINREGYVTEKKCAGVYRITNLKTETTYLAYSDDIPRAVSSSRFSLDLGMHECRSLQKDYAETGLELFVIEKVEETNNRERLEEIKREYKEKGIKLYE